MGQIVGSGTSAALPSEQFSNFSFYYFFPPLLLLLPIQKTKQNNWRAFLEKVSRVKVANLLNVNKRSWIDYPLTHIQNIFNYTHMIRLTFYSRFYEIRNSIPIVKCTVCAVPVTSRSPSCIVMKYCPLLARLWSCKMQSAVWLRFSVLDFNDPSFVQYYGFIYCPCPPGSFGRFCRRPPWQCLDPSLMSCHAFPFLLVFIFLLQLLCEDELHNHRRNALCAFYFPLMLILFMHYIL